jgi:leucine dehydrogenase
MQPVKAPRPKALRRDGGASAVASAAGRRGGMFALMADMDHEQLVFCHEPSCGYRGIIAIHNTTLGPALGGTRFWNYGTEEEAIIDALRLARGMTYKAAVAGLNLGGGKSVIIGDNRTTDRERIFRAHGRFVESLGGRYITAEDVGTSTTDMDFVHMETESVAGLAGRSGDPSPVTAHGVFRGMQAAAQVRWGTSSLEGKTVALQGCGHVGYYLAKELHEDGARIVATDIDPARVRRVEDEFGAVGVSADEIYDAEAEVFAPCALGGIINDDTIPRLKAGIICGGANNQLLEERHGDILEDRGVLYAPDFVVNAGGLINVYGEIVGWSLERAHRKAGEIYDTMLRLLEIARREGMPTYKAADRLAERRIKAVGALKRTWVG